MNICAVDIGNTNISIGYSIQGQWVEHWNLSTINRRSKDEYVILFRELFKNSKHDLNAVDRIAICSVVPTETAPVTSGIQKLLKKDVLVISSKIKHGLVAPIPAELGNDLLANLAAAYHNYQRDSIIVDSGTALTCAAVSEKGEILGVCIMPGIRTALQSLGKSTALLPVVELEAVNTAMGKDTKSAIQGGIVLGFIGAIREITAQMKTQMSGDVCVIGTGGDLHVLHIKEVFTHMDPWHTLSGIRTLALLN